MSKRLDHYLALKMPKVIQNVAAQLSQRSQLSTNGLIAFAQKRVRERLLALFNVPSSWEPSRGSLFSVLLSLWEDTQTLPDFVF